jgi:hypothetical protein
MINSVQRFPNFRVGFRVEVPETAFAIGVRFCSRKAKAIDLIRRIGTVFGKGHTCRCRLRAQICAKELPEKWNQSKQWLSSENVPTASGWSSAHPEQIG